MNPEKKGGGFPQDRPFRVGCHANATRGLHGTHATDAVGRHRTPGDPVQILIAGVGFPRQTPAPILGRGNPLTREKRLCAPPSLRSETRNTGIRGSAL